MKNEIGLEPDIVKKLERRAARKANYVLWVWQGYTAQRDICQTIEEARAAWATAKLGEWDRWELQENGTITKEGVF